MLNPVILVRVSRPGAMNIMPMGLLYLGDALKKSGVPVEVVHCSGDEMFVKADEILQKNPLFVGFSVFTSGDMRMHVDMCKYLKSKNPGIKIVWGNAHAALMPEQTLSNDYIDMISMGEGEELVVELADALSGSGRLDGVKGLGYKKNSRIELNECRPFIKDLDKYYMDFSLINLEQYITEYDESMKKFQRVLWIVSSRGLPL
jgi:radical SAM superfamily enzyme YgiQ (UPF0313 family)